MKFNISDLFMEMKFNNRYTFPLECQNILQPHFHFVLKM